MKSLAVIDLAGTCEGNDQAQNRLKRTACESIAIKDKDPYEAGRVHRHSTHHPDMIAVKDC